MGFWADNAIAITIGTIIFFSIAKWHFKGGVNHHYPNMAGKIVIITGANTGIGYECTNVIAGLGAEKVILACRNPKLGQEAVKKLGHKNIEFMQLDLNDFKSVGEFAKNFSAKYDRVDVLLNNAGIMALPERQVTAQGYEK